MIDLIAKPALLGSIIITKKLASGSTEGTRLNLAQETEANSFELISLKEVTTSG